MPSRSSRSFRRGCRLATSLGRPSFLVLAVPNAMGSAKRPRSPRLTGDWERLVELLDPDTEMAAADRAMWAVKGLKLGWEPASRAGVPVDSESGWDHGRGRVHRGHGVWSKSSSPASQAEME